MLTAKLDPDEILGYNGIGPRTFEEIMELVNTYKFPEEAPAEVLELTLRKHRKPSLKLLSL